LAARDQLELALVENVQREDLDPIETAHAYRQLIDEFGFTQEQLAERVSKARSTVANTLRLLELARPSRRRSAMDASPRGMRVPLPAPRRRPQAHLVGIVQDRDLSVRETRSSFGGSAIARSGRIARTSRRSPGPSTPTWSASRTSFARRSATKVRLAGRGAADASSSSTTATRSSGDSMSA